MSSLDHMRESVRANPAQIEHTAVALVALLVMLMLGIMAGRRLDPIEKQAATLRSASATIGRFRRSYRPPTPAESARWAAGTESIGLSVEPGTRLPLAQSIARIAESAGLHDVRVRFSTLDSLFVPARTAGAATGIAAAKYSVVVDSRGGYGALLELIEGLPSSVAVVRLTVAAPRETTTQPRAAAMAQYHLTLAVYEAANASHAN